MLRLGGPHVRGQSGSWIKAQGMLWECFIQYWVLCFCSGLTSAIATYVCTCIGTNFPVNPKNEPCELDPVSSDKQCLWCSHTGKAMFWTSFSSHPTVQWGSRFLSSLFRVYNKSCLLRGPYPLNTVLSHFVFRKLWGEVIGKISVLHMKKLRFKEIFSSDLRKWQTGILSGFDHCNSW